MMKFAGSEKSLEYQHEKFLEYQHKKKKETERNRSRDRKRQKETGTDKEFIQKRNRARESSMTNKQHFSGDYQIFFFLVARLSFFTLIPLIVRFSFSSLFSECQI